MNEPIVCPGCGKKIQVDVLVLTDTRDKIYGYRGRCPSCDKRTITASSAKEAQAHLAVGHFIGANVI